MSSASATDLPFETAVEIRFQDLDALGHVNNAIYATYCEQARVRFFEEAFDVGLSELNFVIANLEIDYRTPIEDTGEAVVGLGITDVGTTSFRFGYDVVYEGETAATAESVQVVVDPETKSSAPIPDRWRDPIETYRVE